jgi:hypothetical protein
VRLPSHVEHRPPVTIAVLGELEIPAGVVHPFGNLPHERQLSSQGFSASSVAVPRTVTAARAARSRRLTGVNSISP